MINTEFYVLVLLALLSLSLIHSESLREFFFLMNAWKGVDYGSRLRKAYFPFCNLLPKNRTHHLCDREVDFKLIVTVKKKLFPQKPGRLIGNDV